MNGVENIESAMKKYCTHTNNLVSVPSLLGVLLKYNIGRTIGIVFLKKKYLNVISSDQT